MQNKNRKFKMFSLFDGSGGFPLAATLCDIEPVGCSEIEPFPIKVTRARFPNMKHYGDISQINGAELEPVDVITGGSPCQDMSIAGKRHGMSKKCPKCDFSVVGNESINECPKCGTELEYTRSGLFMEQIRVIKEMRKADAERKLQSGRTDEPIRPRFMVWENVTGAFSSNKGEDFRAVLEETARIVDKTASIPRPKNGKWNTDGLIMGDSYSIAWRVLDAQYWGVPQRRRRIALVADFGGQCAGEVLFVREGLSRHFTESRKSWQNLTRCATQGIGETGQCIPRDNINIYDIGDRRSVANESTNISPTLIARMGTGGNNVPVFIDEQYSVDFGRTADRIQMNADKAVTLLGEGGGCGAKTGLYCLPIPIQDQAITNGKGNGLGVGNVGDPMYSLMAETQHGIAVKTYDVRISSEGTKNARCHCYETDTVRTVDSCGNNPDSNHGGVAICEPKNTNTIAIEGNGARPSHRGDGYKESEIMYTLNTTEQHAVCYDKVFRMEAFGSYRESDTASCIKSRDYKDVTDLVANEYIVRRLTPLECSRLQGFPDNWTQGLEIAEPTEEDLQFWREVFETHRKLVTGASKPKTDKQIIKWLQEPHNDSAEYKLWGNGIALPCFLYVMEGIKEILERTSNKTIH